MGSAEIGVRETGIVAVLSPFFGRPTCRFAWLEPFLGFLASVRQGGSRQANYISLKHIQDM